MFGGASYTHTSSFSAFFNSVPESPREVDTKALYSILDVTKDANHTQIKKAFHKLAKEHHPDKGGCAEKFRKVQEAYEILKDPDKKKLYDKFGVEGLKCGGGPTRAGFKGVERTLYKRANKTEDLKYPLKVQLHEMYCGSVRRLQLNKDKICPSCKGNGGHPAGIGPCQSCMGRGIHVKPNGILSQWHHCQQCRGTGKRIDPRFICTDCKGARIVKFSKRLEVRIEKGMQGGHKIVFRQEANEAPGMVPGDVIVCFEEKRHSLFKREGMHLHMTKHITLMEALGGFRFTIRHLDDRILVVNSSPDTIYRPGDVKAILEEGMPAYGDPFTLGNLYIKIEVDFPTSITPESLQVLAKVFPIPRPIVVPSGADQVKLVSVDIEEEKKKYQRYRAMQKNAYDEDQEESQEQPQCRTQ
mmetsp:Transcript_31113/g.54663  ORF Transcript_31113/g.54663 Transcript_31113/m.54663 type:complete len:413 (+) Transcript_31113:104-1342(+)